MLDPDIRRLLDTVFAIPPSSAEPDIALLRAVAEDAAKRLGGDAQPVASVGMIHGFLRWTGEVPAARSWIDAIAAAARELLLARPVREAAG